MPSNYAVIREDNIRRRGEEFDDIGHFISEMLYSDKTHFLFELIQNVEDALERRDRNGGEIENNELVFRLYNDRLEVSHFGIPFNEEDVRGISDVVAGTKADDIKQIGKFGIGFKSVYAYTASPEIHSGDEHFVISRYIRPEEKEAIDLQKGETIIILPFDHQQTSSEEAFEQIHNRLSNLSVRTLLFLKKVEKIRWEVNGKEKGIYQRLTERLSGEDFHRATLLSRENGNLFEEHWLVFSRSIDNPDGKTSSLVEIAYITRGPSQKPIIMNLASSPLFAYFPTSLETNLNFLVQGHFNTTPGRDNIRIDDDWNKKLIQEAAALVVESLQELKNHKLLDVNTLQAMPIERDDFPPDGLFRPIFFRVLDAFQEEPLLPAADGSYVKSDQAKIARGQPLRDLLGVEEVCDLYRGKEYRWLDPEITLDRTPLLRRYLMEDLFVDEVDSLRFARKLDRQFLQKRSDEWMIEFYAFLSDQRALWLGSDFSSKDGVLRQKPIIRLENGEHIAPFDESGEIQVYLRPEGETEFNIVSRRISDDDQAREFLLNLGIKEPDLVDEVILNILPKYKHVNLSLITQDENLSDVNTILKAFRTVSKDKRDKLIQHMQDARLIYAENQKTHKKDYCSIDQVYFLDDDLKEYFSGNKLAWELDYRYLAQKTALLELGVKDRVEIKFKKPAADGSVLLSNSRGQHTRGVHRFDPNTEIEGLEHALENPSVSKAKYIWNELLQDVPHLIQGTIERCSRQTFDRDVDRTPKISKAGSLLLKRSWLPNKDGKFRKPSELSPEDLPPGFRDNPTLASKLNMKLMDFTAAAVDLGVKEELLNLFVTAYQDNPDALEQFLKQRRDDKFLDYEEFSYAEGLETAFSKTGSATVRNSDVHNPSIPDPNRRRRRTQEEIERDQSQEPARFKRFTRVPSRIWEKKDGSVRLFLKEQYGGKCQICGSTFPKRNGDPYFEGLYLIPHTRKAWVDRPGNVLCLCPTCSAKFQHGAVEADSIKDQIREIKILREGGQSDPVLKVFLCGSAVQIKYSDRHILDLQEILKSEQDELGEG